MKRLSLVIIGLIAISTLWAAPISRKQAQQTALQFLQQKGKLQTGDCKLAVKKVRQAETEESCYYYVFNAGHAQGYVVVSGDDRTDAILGYADEGELNPDNIPDNLRTWLDSYADQIKWLDEHNSQTTMLARSAEQTVKTPVAPLLTCNWNQGEPYNLLCPQYNGKYTVTGCVATAMAQVMYYHRQPAQTQMPIPAYTTRTLKLSIAELPVITFDWQDMQDNYNSSTTLNTANKAVAQLMQYCGSAASMDYGLGENGGSAAYTEPMPEVFHKYFGYDKDAKWANRNDYSYREWINLIYDELSRGPVLYSGQSAGGGHAFVCDGYAEDDYFHINWGWGGSSNGYFKLSILSSSYQGIGGSSTTDGYSFGQGAMVNVHPQDDGIDEDTGVLMTTSFFTVDKYQYTRNSNNQDFKIKTYHGVRNQLGETHSFDFGLALYKDDTPIRILNQWYVDDLAQGWGWNSFEAESSFGANLADGEYRIVPVSCEKGNNELMPNINADRHHIIATIEGNNLRLEVINDCNISATLSLQREAIANKPVVIEAAITGIGSEYSGDLLLYRVEGSGNNAQYTRLAGLQVERLERGETRNLTFTFTPKSTGTFKLVLDDKNYNSIATKSIQVKSGTTTSNPTYVSTTIQGLSSSKIYGSTVQVTAKFKNAGSTDFNGSIFVALADYTAGVYTQNKNINAVIPAGESKEISFQFDDLSINHKHQLFYFNYNSNYYSGQFTTQAGVDAYLSDGTKRTTAPAGTITVADNVLALDISKLTTVSKVVPNSNPNTLYIVNANKQPTGLDDKNVVKNNTTATLTLIDGYDFYSPIVFTATKASYTRTFDKGVHDEKGWSTFILPFDVASVKQGDISLDWIPSDADVIKDFWLLEFVTDNNEGVTFDYAGNIKANTPYVIGVPDEKGANDGYRDLTNKPITFSADNAIIQAQSTTSATGDYFKFVGTMQSINDSVYVINTEGNCFDLTPMATVAPFRAYFVGSSDATATCLPIGISPIVTSITDHYSMPISSGSDQLYNLQGQRILQPQKGLYIKSGRIFKK